LEQSSPIAKAEVGAILFVVVAAIRDGFRMIILGGGACENGWMDRRLVFGVERVDDKLRLCMGVLCCRGTYDEPEICLFVAVEICSYSTDVDFDVDEGLP
jgi:hypothetical protein